MNKTLFIFAFLFTSICFSQSVRFDGFIQDEQKNPLEMANIMAVNIATKAYRSKQKGEYKKSLVH